MSLEKIPDVLRALAEEHVDYVLIGAVAMMAHGLVRATEDLDFFVRPDPDNIGRLRAVRVATPAMLYRMKKATVRWKDRIDAQQLRDRFGLED